MSAVVVRPSNPVCVRGNIAAGTGRGPGRSGAPGRVDPPRLSGPRRRYAQGAVHGSIEPARRSGSLLAHTDQAGSPWQSRLASRGCGNSSCCRSSCRVAPNRRGRSLPSSAPPRSPKPRANPRTIRASACGWRFGPAPTPRSSGWSPTTATSLGSLSGNRAPHAASTIAAGPWSHQTSQRPAPTTSLPSPRACSTGSATCQRCWSSSLTRASRPSSGECPGSTTSFRTRHCYPRTWFRAARRSRWPSRSCTGT